MTALEHRLLMAVAVLLAELVAWGSVSSAKSHEIIKLLDEIKKSKDANPEGG